jgi:hybrid cluster-associated redox disulfide protein
MILSIYLSTGIGFSIVLFLIWSKTNKISNEIAGFQQELMSVRAHVNASVKQLQVQTQRPVSCELPEGDDDMSFNKDMAISEIIAKHPHAQNVLADHHLGGCTSCAVSGEHKLGDAIDEYGIDQNALLTGLNGLIRT